MGSPPVKDIECKSADSISKINEATFSADMGLSKTKG